MNVRLLGEVVSDCVFDHNTHGKDMYMLYIKVERQSGVADTVPVLISDQLIDPEYNYTGQCFCIDGDLRSHRDDKNRLLVYVVAQAVTYAELDYINSVNLRGIVCNTPKRRITKTGRELCEFTLAVNRLEYNKSDYIPCVCWGENARLADKFIVGMQIYVAGRFQSREYNGGTAYEVSINLINPKN